MSNTNINKALLIAVIVLAAALIGVLVYFLVPKLTITPTLATA